jgi:hypothetical protein
MKKVWEQTRALAEKNFLIKRSSKFGALFDLLVPTYICYMFVTKLYQQGKLYKLVIHLGSNSDLKE